MSGNAQDPTALGVRGDGAMVLAGTFAGTIDFGGGPLRAATKTSAFVARLAPDAGYVGATAIVQDDPDLDPPDIAGAAIDDDGNAIVGGALVNATSLGGVDLAPAQAAGFVATLTPAAAPLAQSIFGLTDPTGEDTVIDVASAPDGGVVFTADVGSATDFGNGHPVGALRKICLVRLGPLHP